jgi:sRNA-binding protein
MGWSVPYTLSVLRHWKMAAVYCRAVLAHDQRITLDGAPAEAVDAEAKELATKQLARIEARNTVKKKAMAPAKPTPAPPIDRVRAKPSRRHKARQR